MPLFFDKNYTLRVVSMSIASTSKKRITKPKKYMSGFHTTKEGYCSAINFDEKLNFVMSFKLKKKIVKKYSKVDNI